MRCLFDRLRQIFYFLKFFRFLHPDCDPDRAQKLISSSMSRYLSTRKISSKSMHTFLSNLANRQTDKQTSRAIAYTSSFVGGKLHTTDRHVIRVIDNNTVHVSRSLTTAVDQCVDSAFRHAADTHITLMSPCRIIWKCTQAFPLL